MEFTGECDINREYASGIYIGGGCFFLINNQFIAPPPTVDFDEYGNTRDGKQLQQELMTDIALLQQ